MRHISQRRSELPAFVKGIFWPFVHYTFQIHWIAINYDMHIEISAVQCHEQNNNLLNIENSYHLNLRRAVRVEFLERNRKMLAQVRIIACHFRIGDFYHETDITQCAP
jgi:hypothetical protein